MELYDSYHPHLHKVGDPIAPPKTRWIWKVFWYLLAVTLVEVGLASINYYGRMGWDAWLKPTFILLTLLKAYYIIFSYMHLKDERKNFKLTLGFLIIILGYFIMLLMIEGYYQTQVRMIFPDFLKQTIEAHH